jgi:hypothetical protein
MSRRLPAVALGLLTGAGCAPEPTIPAQPTWADVSPILRAECAQCHGSTALRTGFGYRLDFFDMTDGVCGEAARAMPSGSLLAGAAATAILGAVSPSPNGGRERMPPLPGLALRDWQRETLIRWAARPVKGPPPAGNRPPSIQVTGLPPLIDGRLTFTAFVTDPDADEVVGVIKIADALFTMNRSGTFAADLNTSTWPAGMYRLTAVVCDGWSSVDFDLGPLEIRR